MDFTLKTYCRLLDALIGKGYAFQTCAEFLQSPAQRAIILRHDVEARYGNALEFARIQHERNIRGTYYFRILPDHFDREIIRRIAAMGHEIGYHYDDLSHCHGDYEAAIRRFETNLAMLREIADVKTICMEGAPLSKWDNRDLWGQSAVRSPQSAVGSQVTKSSGTIGILNYRNFGIIGEPYFDIDFSKVFYLTDTGRRWDGKGSVRDRVSSWQSSVVSQVLRFRHTKDIIEAADSGLLPDQIMFTFHPQRWSDKPIPWLQELVMQNVKNVAKRLIVRREG